MQFLKDKLIDLQDSFLFLCIGISLGLSRVYIEFTSRGEPIPTRLAFARAITTGGLSMSAGAVLIWYPEAPLPALLGVAAFVASVGTSMLENILVRWIAGGKQ